MSSKSVAFNPGQSLNEGLALHRRGQLREAEKIYTKELTSRFPLEVPRPMSEVSYNLFRQQYLSRLSEEIGRLFYEYANGDDITDVN